MSPTMPPQNTVVPLPCATAEVRVLGLRPGGLLADHVQALVAVDMPPLPPQSLAVVPHDGWMLGVAFGRDADAIDAGGGPGRHGVLTGLRRWTGRWTARGNHVTLMALLTPLGAVELLDAAPLDSVPTVRAPLETLLGDGVPRQLEQSLARLNGLEARLLHYARWLEGRVERARRTPRAALRAARAAMRLRAAPRLAIETLADEQHCSRRQLERDCTRWLGASPRQLAQLSRVQAMARLASAGAGLADIAADLGYADQAHMTRSVRELTGLTPSRLVRSDATLFGRAFRSLTGGGIVYL